MVYSFMKNLFKDVIYNKFNCRSLLPYFKNSLRYLYFFTFNFKGNNQFPILASKLRVFTMRA